MLDKLAEGVAVEGMESFAPVARRRDGAAGRPPAGRSPWCSSATRSASARRAHDLVATSQEFLQASWAAAAAGDRRRSTWAPPRTARSATSATTPSSSARRGGADRAVRRGDDLVRSTRTAGVHERATVSATARPTRTAATPAARARRHQGLARRRQGRWSLVTEGHGPAERLVEVLSDVDVPARLVDGLDAAPERDVVQVTTGRLAHGFVAEPQAGRADRATT